MTKSAIIGYVGLGLLIAAACSSSSDTKTKQPRTVATTPPGGDSGGTGSNCIVNCVATDAGDSDAEIDTYTPPPSDGGLQPYDDPLPDACAGQSASTEPKPVVLQMVVDVSASMNLSPANSADTKWNITRNALVGAMGTLPPSVWIGVQFFPNEKTGTWGATPQQPHTTCVDQKDNVNIAPLNAPGSAQRLAIDGAFGRVTPVSGAGTPTLDAYELALEEIYSRSDLPVDKFMLLITDGQPTYAEWCVGNGVPTVTNPTLAELTDPIVNRVSTAHAAGVKTFVIGSPGSEQGADTNIDARPWMSRAARAGGTDLPGCADTAPNFCHFDMTQSQNFAADLALALQQIANTVVPCVYDVVPPDGGTIDTQKINVFYTSGGQRYLVLQNKSSSCELGWRFVPGTNDSQIEICGSTCDQIRADPGATMDLFYGCESFGVVT
jgi:hypothetical protein